MSDDLKDASVRSYNVRQALSAADQVVTVARCVDDSAEWGEHHVSIRAKHLAALIGVAKEAGYERFPAT